MAIKDMICGGLEAADNAFGCDDPEPSRPTLCLAINASQAALDCDAPSPGQGCLITGCDPGLYCNPVEDLCLVQKQVDEPCLSDIECITGVCSQEGFCTVL